MRTLFGRIIDFTLVLPCNPVVKSYNSLLTNHLYSCFWFYALFAIERYFHCSDLLSISVHLFPFGQRTLSTVIVIVIKVSQSFAFSLANSTLPAKGKIAKSSLGNTPVYFTSLTPCYLTLIPKKKKMAFLSSYLVISNFFCLYKEPRIGHQQVLNQGE